MGRNLYYSLQKATEEIFSGLKIDLQTPVASIGTCFAEELAGHMKSSGGNYIIAEANNFNSSANWGRVYTLPNLRQIVAYSLQAMPLSIMESGGKFLDPLREKSIGFFSTSQDAEKSISRHRRLSRQVFETANVLVMTLGQNEAWEDRELGIVWGSIPPGRLREAQPDRFSPVTFSVADCSDALSDIIDLLRSVNPGLTIILTVSPVAAYATFRSQCVITQSMEGKAILRTVAGEACRNLDNVYYFPSFEMVMCQNPHTFNADNRHVKRGTVARIFNLLDNVIR